MLPIIFTIIDRQIRGGVGDVTKNGLGTSVTFRNQSGGPVDVFVFGVSGTRPGSRSDPAPGSLFGHGAATLTVPAGEQTYETAVDPNRGEYHLTTDRGDASAARGLLRVNSFTFHVDDKGNVTDNEGLDVQRFTNIPVIFENASDQQITLFAFPEGGRAPSTTLTLFQTGGDVTVYNKDNPSTRPPRGVDPGATLPDGIEWLNVPARTTAGPGKLEVVIRGDGAAGKFTISAKYPVCSNTGWINHQPPM